MVGQRVHHTRRHKSRQEELRFLFGLVAIAKQHPSSPPIMLGAKRIVSIAHGFAAFRAYSNATPANIGMGQEECKIPVPKRFAQLCGPNCWQTSKSL